MKTAEQIINEAQKEYPELEIDSNWNLHDALGVWKIFLFDEAERTGIALEENSQLGKNGERTFTWCEYFYIKDDLSDIYGTPPKWEPYWKLKEDRSGTGSEEDAIVAVYDFCDRMDNSIRRTLKKLEKRMDAFDLENLLTDIAKVQTSLQKIASKTEREDILVEVDESMYTLGCVAELIEEKLQ